MTVSPALPTVGEAAPDVLGDGYESFVISLPDDADGPTRATLVRRRAQTPGTRAVLYVHGFADYFFQTELADFHANRGTDFYAIDLRRYGRSLLTHQMPNQMNDVSDYYPELDAAINKIVEDGHDSVTVIAHSTGGLIVPLWLADRQSPAPVDALVLNSPFLEINADRFVRVVVGTGVDAVARFKPAGIVPIPALNLYGRSIHRSGDGEWDFNLDWKPLTGMPIRAGWLAAVRRAQARLAHNLQLPMPILVLSSASTFRGRKWSEAIFTGDAVLDADRIADLSTRLGRQVTCVRIANGMHDLILSRPAVRENVYEEIGRWLDRYQAG